MVRNVRCVIVRGRAVSERTALHDVPTQDSLNGYVTQTVLPDKPSSGAPLDVRKDYIERQLDSLVGYQVLGNLRVLGGYMNRLHGGAASALSCLPSAAYESMSALGMHVQWTWMLPETAVLSIAHQTSCALPRRGLC